MAQVATLSVVYLNTFWTGRNWSPLELLPFLCMHKAKSFQEELQLLRSQAVPWYLQLCQYLRAVPFAYLMVYLYSVTVELQHFRGFSPTLKPLGLVTFQLVATTPHWFGSHLDRASALNLANPLRFLSGFWFTLTSGGIFWCVFSIWKWTCCWILVQTLGIAFFYIGYFMNLVGLIIDLSI